VISKQTTTKLPSMEQAIDIIALQLDRAEQIRQCRFMEETQSRAFAEQVWKKVVAAGKDRKK
jgi:hypothetical protein